VKVIWVQTEGTCVLDGKDRKPDSAPISISTIRFCPPDLGRRNP
jgi:hypothetical protein